MFFSTEAAARLAPGASIRRADMFEPHIIILYVKNVPASAEFYAGLLGKPPVESSPNFAMFTLSSGMNLGLWAAHDAQPKPKAAGGGAELALTVPDKGAVSALHAEWAKRGAAIAQPPVEMDFGYTFTATDPDGHRLRVMALNAP
jgi:catechol 2,3-dioxygenase-like lactoylglutathione lyase family enzyme